MRWFNRWYGANPLHLLALIGCFALAWYAGEGLLHAKPAGVAVWFAGAVVGHDVILFPLYALADKSVTTVFRHRPPKLPTVPWINYLRVPVVLSGLLLLLWFPLIFKIPSRFPTTTDLTLDPYMGHWLVVTGALFLLSAVAFAFRLRPGRSQPAPAWAGEHDPVRLPQGPPAAQGWDGQDRDTRDWDARGRRTGPYDRYGDPAGPPQRPRGAPGRRTRDWQIQDRQAQEDWRTWDYSSGQGQSRGPGSGRHRQPPPDDRHGPGQPRSEPPWPPQQWPGQLRPAPPQPAGQWPGDGRYWADSEDDDLHWAEEASRRQRPRPGQPRPGDTGPWPYDR